MQTFTNIALAILKIFSVVKSANFLRTFDTKRPDVSRVKRKIGRAHPINVVVDHDLLKFRLKPILYLSENLLLYSIKPFYRRFSRTFLIYA